MLLSFSLPSWDSTPIMQGKQSIIVRRLKKLYDPVKMMSTWSNICSHAPTLRIEMNGDNNRNAAGISITKVVATPRRSSRGCSWCACQANGPGRHCVAKWYSSAVRLFHVGQSACILTIPDMNISLKSRNLIGHDPTSSRFCVSLHLSVRVRQGAKHIPVKKPVSISNTSHWKV